MNKEFMVYLAGPISGLSYGESTDWRKHVASLLPPNILPLSPMRHKEYLLQERVIADRYEASVLSSATSITCRDRFDVQRCDFVFVNFLGAKKVSIGTVIEIAWADLLRKPVIVIMEEENIHEHAMLERMTGFRLETLEKGVETLCKVLLPGV